MAITADFARVFTVGAGKNKNLYYYFYVEGGG